MASTYTTVALVQTKFGELLVDDLADVAEDGSGDDDATIDDAIEDAGRTIDAYCGGRYEVPFALITDATPTPGIIQTIARWLTLAELLETRTEHSKQRELYRKKAIDLLKEIRKGDADVPGGTLLDADENIEQGFAIPTNLEPAFSGHDEDNDNTDLMDDW